MSLTKVSYSMIAEASANVVDFGADKTGATSANTAILAAIASLSADGGTVFFPAGTYAVSTVIAVTRSNIKFVGEPGAIVEITGAAIHNAFEFTGCVNIVFSGLQFEWNGAALNTSNPGWENNFALLFEADDSFNSCHDVTIENCEFVECATFTTPYVSAAQETAIASDPNKTFKNFVFKSNRCSGTLTRGGESYVTAVSTYYLTDYIITDNIFSYSTGSFNVMTLLGAGSVGGGNRYSYSGLVANNVLSGSGHAVFIGASKNILVSSNVLKDFEAESIDFECCEACAARGNHLSNVKYAFALFYQFVDIEITDNHVELADDADYFLNHSPTGSPAISTYGNLLVQGNTGTCVAGSVYFQLQMGHGITIKNNVFRNVVYTATSNYYWIDISDNSFTWDRLNPDAASWLILPADLSSSNQSGYVKISNNQFIATQALDVNCILLYANQTFNNEFYITNNVFMNITYPVNYDSAAPNRAYNRTLFFDNVIEGSTSPYAIGGGSPTPQFVFKGLINRSGLSVFSDTADFATKVGTGGCGLGSTFLRNPPASGQAYGWVNTSSTGTPTWTVISTLP